MCQPSSGHQHAQLGNQMIVVSGWRGFRRVCTTEGDSPDIDIKELAEAKSLGRCVAEVTARVKVGSAK